MVAVLCIIIKSTMDFHCSLHVHTNYDIVVGKRYWIDGAAPL